MERYSVARSSRPGWWLLGALVADMTTYAFAREGTTGAFFWVLLDLWLAHRIWRSGARALTVFRFLQTLGAVLFGFAIAFGGPLNIQTAATPMVVALYGLSAWCLFAPALDAVVARRQASVLAAH